MGGKDETALPKEKVEADSVGGAMLSVDDVGMSRDRCELERTKISKVSDGSVHKTENEARSQARHIHRFRRAEQRDSGDRRLRDQFSGRKESKNSADPGVV